MHGHCHLGAHSHPRSPPRRSSRLHAAHDGQPVDASDGHQRRAQGAASRAGHLCHVLILAPGCAVWVRCDFFLVGWLVLFCVCVCVRGCSVPVRGRCCMCACVRACLSFFRRFCDVAGDVIFTFMPSMYACIFSEFFRAIHFVPRGVGPTFVLCAHKSPCRNEPRCLCSFDCSFRALIVHAASQMHPCSILTFDFVLTPRPSSTPHTHTLSSP